MTAETGVVVELLIALSVKVTCPPRMTEPVDAVLLIERSAMRPGHVTDTAGVVAVLFPVLESCVA